MGIECKFDVGKLYKISDEITAQMGWMTEIDDIFEIFRSTGARELLNETVMYVRDERTYHVFLTMSGLVWVSDVDLSSAFLCEEIITV